jgi:hypothetical protein
MTGTYHDIGPCRLYVGSWILLRLFRFAISNRWRWVEDLSSSPVSNFLKVGGGGGVIPVTLSPVGVGVITSQSGPRSEWIIFRWSKTV